MNQALSAPVIVGVDTHKLTHAAVALTGLGACLGGMTIPASAKGYRDLETWAKSLGAVQAFVALLANFGPGCWRSLAQLPSLNWD